MNSEEKHIGISICLDAETNELLEQASKLSYRSKRKEAAYLIKSSLMEYKETECLGANSATE